MIINEVKEMQQQGLNEDEIIQHLKEKGYSPLEISQSIEQSKIKSIVSQENSLPQDMQPSLMAEEAPMQSIQEQQAPQPMQTPQNIPEQIPQYEEPQLPAQYSQYQEYQPYSSEAASEIAEQVAEEKISAMRKELRKAEDFRLTASKKIESIDERLKKIESIIDSLQMNIIEKIGSYGEMMQDMKQEMGMMQESFSKAINPIIDKARDNQENEAKETSSKKGKSKKSDGFEHYLRR